jgi:hypothetical protein
MADEAFSGIRKVSKVVRRVRARICIILILLSFFDNIRLVFMLSHP